jgi:hypothetical protein
MAWTGYQGQEVVLATLHGKEKVLARPLRWGLGATLVHLSGVDTDSLGSFCGTQPRSLSMRATCLAKARLALEHGGGRALAIASEGSFGPHPAVPLLPVGRECLAFLDRERGLAVVEQGFARRTNFSQHRLEPDQATAALLPPSLERWLQQVGFPSHALLVRPLGDGVPAQMLRKGIHEPETLRQALLWAAAAAPAGRVQLETDMRAHANPTRMASIRALAFQLVRRLRNPCPRCGSPGWGLVGNEAGLPCADCQQPTPLIRAEILGCAACGSEEHRPRHDGLRAADPGQCPHCNP